MIYSFFYYFLFLSSSFHSDLIPYLTLEITKSTVATTSSFTVTGNERSDWIRSFQLTTSEVNQRMGQKKWLILLMFSCLCSFSCGRELKVKHKDNLPIYNHTLTTILVEYASAVYMSDLTQLFTWTCPRCDGLTKGFEIIEIIVDVQHCLQGFVGVAKDPDAIVIAFRGTQEHSIQNWVEDLFWKQLDLNYPGMTDAMVHHGFYSAYHNTTIRPGVLSAVKRAKEIYGEFKVIVTGHSMGGAMAAFCGLDLAVNHEVQDVQVMTFGQPRIGNAAFASCYSKLVPNTIRVTNEHDMVPHLPPYYSYFPQKTYHHFPREVWLYNIGVGSLVYKVEKICDGSGEDPSCSRSVTGNSISDHLVYFGVELGCDTWRSCGIVMDTNIIDYKTTDFKGNFILSRNPATPTLKLKTESDIGSKNI
ncbi:lipase-like isoform X2 [Pistacia vera]|nr:lipase-like isoform X2 [Pistacia vera]